MANMATVKKKKTTKKVIQLKQYMVSGAKPNAKDIEIVLLVLATSPIRAAEFFRQKFPGYNIWGSCTQVAQSEFNENDIPNIPDNRRFFLLKK